MTDIAQTGIAPTGPGGLSVHTSGDARKRLARRYAAERRFRAYGIAAIAVTGNAAQLGEHSVGQPAQQGSPFGISQVGGVIAHRRLHKRPVGHCGAHIGQRFIQRGAERAALARHMPSGFT